MNQQNRKLIDAVRVILNKQGVREMDTYSDKTKSGRTFKFYDLRLMDTGEQISFKRRMQCKFALLTLLSEKDHANLNPRFVESSIFHTATSLSITLPRNDDHYRFTFGKSNHGRSFSA